MLFTLIGVYLTGWIGATVVVFTASNRLSEPGLPGGYRLALSVVAGVVWPILLIGAIEFTSLAWYSKRRAERANESPVSVDGHRANDRWSRADPVRAALS